MLKAMVKTKVKPRRRRGDNMLTPGGDACTGLSSFLYVVFRVIVWEFILIVSKCINLANLKLLSINSEELYSLCIRFQFRLSYNMFHNKS